MLFIIFIKYIILITYTYLMMIDSIKQKIKFELISFFNYLVWNLIN
jgi:hypothetical protein